MVTLIPEKRCIKSAAVLGSTGSVGVQTMDVVRELGLRVDFLAAGRNTELLRRQIGEFHPTLVAVADGAAASKLANELKNDSFHPEIIWRNDELEAAVLEADADIIFHSIGGLAGLGTAIAAAKSGKRIAMANKEAIISAGELIFSELKRSGGELIPVDSEHSAIYRCLAGHSDTTQVKKILLTASGGPFFGRTFEQLGSVNAADALAHPTWKMGPKITIDSATMMNKGFEIIEACKLYDVPEERVEVLIHRQSIIHSMVEYNDNTVIAELGAPDMRDCIRYAATAPDTASVHGTGLDFAKIGSLTFDKPDTNAFPLLEAAREAIRLGGTAPVSLIAADEAAVCAFLEDSISFTDISSFVIETMQHIDVSYEITAESIGAADRQARAFCGNLIKFRKGCD